MMQEEKESKISCRDSHLEVNTGKRKVKMKSWPAKQRESSNVKGPFRSR